MTTIAPLNQSLANWEELALLQSPDHAKLSQKQINELWRIATQADQDDLLRSFLALKLLPTVGFEESERFWSLPGLALMAKSEKCLDLFLQVPSLFDSLRTDFRKDFPAWWLRDLDSGERWVELKKVVPFLLGKDAPVTSKGENILHFILGSSGLHWSSRIISHLKDLTQIPGFWDCMDAPNKEGEKPLDIAYPFFQDKASWFEEIRLSMLPTTDTVKPKFHL